MRYKAYVGGGGKVQMARSRLDSNGYFKTEVEALADLAQRQADNAAAASYGCQPHQETGLLERSEFDQAKWGCPKCDSPLETDTDQGDGFARCGCGAVVPLPEVPE